MLAPWKVMTNLDIVWKSKDIILLMNVHIVKAVTCSHVQMWKVDHKVGWAPENWCFWIVVLEKTLESPLDCKEIKPVHPKGNQPWIYAGRTDAEAEAPVLWPPDAKNWLIGKDPDAGKDWRQKEERVAEDLMVRYYHWLNGYELEQTPGNTEGQGNLCAAVRGVTKSWAWLNDWITTTRYKWEDRLNIDFARWRFDYGIFRSIEFEEYSLG